jgi:hypothetical protein
MSADLSPLLRVRRSRQETRHALTRAIYLELHEKYQMPRRVMRKMARDMMHTKYHQLKKEIEDASSRT